MATTERRPARGRSRPPLNGLLRGAERARVGVLLVGLIVSAGAGYVAASHKKVPILAGGALLAIGVVAFDPLLLAVLTAPATLLAQRLGGSASGSNLGMSDVLLVLAVACALPVIRLRNAPNLKLMLGLCTIYEASALFSILAHPNSHDSLEWAHRFVVVGGGMLVGSLVAVSGRQRQALMLYLLGAGVLGLVTLEHSVTLHFHPAQWGVYQKNYIGTVMWTAVMIAHVDPAWARFPRRLTGPVKYVCLLGLLASQSKQAIIALAVSLIVAMILDRDVRQRSKIILLTALPIIIFAYIVGTHEVASSHTTINSATTRAVAYSSDWKVWHLDPLLGQGPRWYYLPQFSDYLQPPDVLIEALTDTGLVGTIGLACLFFGTMWVLFRMPRQIGTLALAVMVARVAQSAFDVYWVSVSITMSWLLAGIAAGLADSQLVESQAHDPIGQGLVS